jgi:predicted NAD/FAD-dependent oxidoreductase
LGQFDRPFRPEKPILGSVRRRPTEQHARRLDVARYREKVSRPAVDRSCRVAVVGTGLSGLICARALSDHGLGVVVFDDGSRTEVGLAAREALCFSASDPRFLAATESWIEDGWVTEESVRASRPEGSAARSFRVPEMSSLLVRIAEGLTLKHNGSVSIAKRKNLRWFIEHDSAEEGPYDIVVLAVPGSRSTPPTDPVPRPRVAGIEIPDRAQNESSSTFDGRKALATCSDGLDASNVEASFLSGSAAAGRVLGWLARNRAPAQGSLFD